MAGAAPSVSDIRNTPEPLWGLTVTGSGHPTAGSAVRAGQWSLRKGLPSHHSQKSLGTAWLGRASLWDGVGVDHCSLHTSLRAAIAFGSHGLRETPPSNTGQQRLSQALRALQQGNTFSSKKCQGPARRAGGRSPCAEQCPAHPAMLGVPCFCLATKEVLAVWTLLEM